MNASINKPNKVRVPSLNQNSAKYRHEMEKSFIIYVKC